MSKPGSETLSGGRNFGGHATNHLREESALQVVGVSHESVCI